MVLLLSLLLAGGLGRFEDRLEDMMRAGIRKVEAEIAAPRPEPETREVVNAGLATLVLSGDPRAAERLVLWAFRHQNLDSGSPAFGTIPWRVAHPEIRDSNAIEFCTQALGPLFLGYGGHLSPEFREQMRPHLAAAIEGVRHHTVPITYTNIFLMKATNLLLVGQAIGDEKAVAEGEALLDDWVAHTRRAGIGEFDSPNYYIVDLNSLQMGYRFAAKPRTREKYRAILDFFWADIAANFYPGRGTLSGPHSRTYAFLTGHEPIELALELEGLLAKPTAVRAGLGRIYLLLSEKQGGYRPPQPILALARLPEKVVRSRWRAEPAHDRTNYITPDFAIGSTSTHYTGHDKLINIELGSRPEGPVVYIAPDLTDRPYGQANMKGPSGHTKPYHLPLNAASVQEKGALLVLLHIDSLKPGDSASFRLNVVHPRQNSTLFDTLKNPVLGVQVDSGGLAVRFVHVPEGFRVAQRTDEVGLAAGAQRFVLEPDGAEIRHNSTLFAGILFLAGSCPNKANLESLARRVAEATVDSTRKEGIWRLKVKLDGVELEAARQMSDGSIVERWVNGRPIPEAVLSVNGRDLAGYLPAN